MSVAAPRAMNEVERKVEQLRGSGLSETQLRLGCAATLRQQLPLRDAIVLREAQRFEVDTDAASAWTQVLQRLRSVVAEPTSALHAPLAVVGAEGDRLFLAAPKGIRVWVERRYLSLIREALKATDSGYTDVEFIEEVTG